MMNSRFFILLIFLFATELFAQCPREVAVNDYNNNFLTTSWDLNELAWTGDIASCNAGTISASVQNKTIQRINYFRRMCALDDNTTLNPALNASAQESALMQEANGSLSHCTGANGAPCDTWLCNTPGAIQASQQGNLAWGTWNWVDPIELYMEDSGAGNVAVGHRRWILYSGGQEFGNGVTANRETLYVINNFGNPPNNQLPYIAYPPNDFIPAPLVYPRWSFGVPGFSVNFTNATVTMTDALGNNVPLTIIYNASVNFGDKSVVWEPVGINTNSPQDVQYTVTVSNIVGAPQTSYTYTTTIIQPTHPPACAAGESWHAASCACINTSSCPPNLAVNGNPIASGDYKADIQVSSNGSVPATNTVSFRAGDNVLLQPNFEASSGLVGLTVVLDTKNCPMAPIPRNTVEPAKK